MFKPAPLTALLLGTVLVLATLIAAFEVVLLPRPVRRRIRLNRYFFKCTWALWASCADLWPVGRRREDFIGVYGPLSMVMLFAFWGTCPIVGFGLMHSALLGLVPEARSDTLVSEIIVSGDAFFTLGYGDNVPAYPLARLLVVFEAGTGFGFIALTIGYLPVRYQHFTRRDLELIEFSARLRAPPRGPGRQSAAAPAGLDRPGIRGGRALRSRRGRPAPIPLVDYQVIS